VNVLLFLVKTFTDLYLLVVLLRFLLQWVGVDFYNPFSQFVVQATNPVVRPARRLIPSAGTVDLATLVVLVLLELVFTYFLVALLGGVPSPGLLLWWVVLRLVSLTIWAYTLCIFVYVILSLIAPGTYNAIGAAAAQIAEPLVRPFRRIVPVLGGFDFSPAIALILLYAASIALGDLGLPGALR
jgi:YggT family protein